MDMPLCLLFTYEFVLQAIFIFSRTHDYHYIFYACYEYLLRSNHQQLTDAKQTVITDYDIVCRLTNSTSPTKKHPLMFMIKMHSRRN